jgi:16S rRNA (uracil1498-N3)-methyltransferase
MTLLPWEGEETLLLRDALKSKRPSPLTEAGRGGYGVINLFFGPEGGFSPAEVEKTRARGGVPLSLGPLILRTETAGLMVASALLYAFGVLK